MRDVSKEFQKIPPEALRNDFAAIVAGVGGGGGPAAAGRTGEGEPTTSRRQDAQPRPVHGEPHRAGQAGEDRPGARPRLRGPSGGGHPDPAPPEQSDPRGRGRRGQDGGGRGLRHADRRRRRPGAAQERHAADARPGTAPGRRGGEGRVREPPQGPHRGGQGVARRRSSCSSTRRTR